MSTLFSESGQRLGCFTGDANFFQVMEYSSCRLLTSTSGLRSCYTVLRFSQGLTYNREARGAAKRDVLRRKIFGPRQIRDTDDRFPEICLALNTDCL